MRRSLASWVLFVLPLCAFTACTEREPPPPVPFVTASATEVPDGDGYTATPSSQYLALLPDGEAKRRFILDCTGCHQFDPKTIGLDGKLKGHAEWLWRTEQMLSFAGADTGFPVMSPSRDAHDTADWLIAHLGDETQPLPDLAPPAVETDASVTFTEYDLPAPQDLPHDLVLDPEGRLVITGQLSGQMYVLDPATGDFTQRSIPVPGANPRALHVDADGTWWVLLGGPEQIARLAPGGDWETWDIGMHPHSIVRAPDGQLWFNGHFSKSPEQIGVLDPATGAVTTYDVPAEPMPDGGTTMPYGLRHGPDGTLWGTQLIGSRLVRFDPATERFTLYDLPTPYSGPRRPDISPDGTVWIPEYAAGKLARFDPQTETFTEYDLPIKDALPYIVRVDAARGWVWIATAGADALLRFFPDEERFTVHPYPKPNSIVRHMDLEAETGTLWFSYGNFPSIHPKIVKAKAASGK